MNATLPNVNPEALEPPIMPGEWSLKQIESALSRPLPQCLLAQRKQGGTTLTYIPWHTANKILSKYCPGWTWQITQIQLSDSRLFMVEQ
ncbi:hypothetical protein RIF25_10555 [Thermosynechococcaceae cyanobacterium BACA0444]|uniref:Uncharacterized protein n=1 Tax=Pseudocalidococcus azoricus BACA0444 TaxID=2918990 RepID=A0AAE4FTG3_9CYAN|nr:hypothetical protein [Pseudocalidococcus azoricus]MDS3861247.1 hypothetical protein [Pseudocalidococcus azoricus BACA0444]